MSFRKKKDKKFTIAFHKQGLFHEHPSKLFGSSWISIYTFKDDKLTCRCGICLPVSLSLGYNENFYSLYYGENERAVGREPQMSHSRISEEDKAVWDNEEFWSECK